MKKKSSSKAHNSTHALIFTHMEDLDGIVSGTIAYYYYLQVFPKDQITVELLNYREVEPTMRKYLPLWENYFISISDLGLNPKFMAFILTLPQKTQFKPTHIYIDHHEVTGDISIITDKFNEYINPFRNKEEIKIQAPSFLDPVSSNLSYAYYSKYQEKPFPNHFKDLVEYAFQTDHEGQMPRAPDRIAIQLKQYISFYQLDKSKLFELIAIFIDEAQYSKFIAQLDDICKNIEHWYEEQRQIIRDNVQFGEFQNLTYVHVIADLRSGEITKYLQDLYPNKDLYIGMSWREKYMNLRTKAPIAADVAQIFGGGGHKDRSGFLIPEKYIDLLSQQKNPVKISLDFIQEIVLGYWNHMSLK